MADKETILTYENLYEILRSEKYKPELQKLETSFYKDILNYLKEKRAILSSQQKKDSVFAKVEIDKTKKQIENISKIITELYEKREVKIIQLALLASRTKPDEKVMDLILPEEKGLYEVLLKELSYFREAILKSVLAVKKPVLEKPKTLKDDNLRTETKLVKFLHPLPKFVGTDLFIYGPFEKEQVAKLPGEVAELLIKKKRAEEI